jgi:hypothetical protein
MIRFGCGRIYIFFHRNLPENIHLLPPKSAREYTFSSTEICQRIYIFFHRNLLENIHLLPPKSAREYTSSSTEICQRIYIFFHRNLPENIHLLPPKSAREYTSFSIYNIHSLLPHTISKLTSTTYNIQTYFYHIQHPNLLLPHATSKLTSTTCNIQTYSDYNTQSKALYFFILPPHTEQTGNQSPLHNSRLVQLSS